MQKLVGEAMGNLYTKAEIEEMISSSAEDPSQEYLCQYSIGKDSIFGNVSAEDQQGMSEWLSNDDDDEDNYDEEKDKDGIHWHENN